MQKTDKKRRFSFFSHWKNKSAKSKDSSKTVSNETNTTLASSSKIYRSLREPSTPENVLCQDQQDYFTTLEGTKLRNIHKDAGILFLTSDNQLRWKNEAEKQKHVQFAPTPLNKYHTYDIRPSCNADAVQTKLSFIEKENFDPKTGNSIVSSNSCFSGFASKIDGKNTDLRRSSLRLKTPMPRTSTKSALVDQTNIISPHFDVSVIIGDRLSLMGTKSIVSHHSSTTQHSDIQNEVTLKSNNDTHSMKETNCKFNDQHSCTSRSTNTSQNRSSLRDFSQVHKITAKDISSTCVLRNSLPSTNGSTGSLEKDRLSHTSYVNIKELMESQTLQQSVALKLSAEATDKISVELPIPSLRSTRNAHQEYTDDMKLQATLAVPPFASIPIKSAAFAELKRAKDAQQKICIGNKQRVKVSDKSKRFQNGPLTSSPQKHTNCRLRKFKYDGVSSLADDERSLNCSCSGCLVGYSENKELPLPQRSKTKLFFPKEVKHVDVSSGVSKLSLLSAARVSSCDILHKGGSWYNCNDSMCKSPITDTDAGDKCVSCYKNNPENEIYVAEDYDTPPKVNPTGSAVAKDKPCDLASGESCNTVLEQPEKNGLSCPIELPTGMSPQTKKLSESCLFALQGVFCTLYRDQAGKPKTSVFIDKNNDQGNSSDSTIVIKISRNSISSEREMKGSNQSSGSSLSCKISSNSEFQKNIVSESPRPISLPDLTSYNINNKDDRPISSLETASETEMKSAYGKENNVVSFTKYANERSLLLKDQTYLDKHVPADQGTISGAESNSGYSTIESSSDLDTSPDAKGEELLQKVIRDGMGATPVKIPKKVIQNSKSPSKSKFKAKDVLSGRAKLKLSITCDKLVTIHIIKAVKLTSVRTLNLNPYVKVSLHPDDSGRVHWRTKVVHDQSCPVFNQKFSFETISNDDKKRLIFSVWHRDLEKKRSEFLGCMSFGMHTIMESNQNVIGWYRLLKEVVGTQKHFASRHGTGNAFSKLLGH